jgi:hypothetical protein
MKTSNTPIDPMTTCLCCGNAALEGDYDICHQCGWENDPTSWTHPDDPLTANHMSLTEARKNYQETGSYNREPLLFSLYIPEEQGE